MPKYINPYQRYVGPVMPNWLLRRPEVSLGAKAVWARLAQYHGQKGKAFPLLATLAREVGLSDRQTQRYLAELQQHKLIFVQTRKADRLSSIYRFLEHPWEKEGYYVEDSDPNDTSDVTLTTDVSSDTRQIRRIEENQLRESLEENQHSPSGNGGPEGPQASASVVRVADDEIDQGEGSAAITPSLENSETWEDRLSAVTAAGDAGSSKSIAQAQENARKRRERQLREGAADQQRRENLKGKPASKDIRALEKTWREEMDLAFPDTLIVKWGGKDRGQVTRMIEDCGSLYVVENTLRYVVRNWKTLRERFFKGKGNAVPSLGFILSMRATVVPEAEIWKKHAAVLEEWDRVKREIDDPFAYPEDLRAKVQVARAELEQIGLG